MHETHWSQSFLPMGMLRRLHAAGPALPCSVQVRGAVIFVDVSHYTNLVERLVQQGPAGLESIPRVLGRYWSRSIDAIYELGGEALLFAGDGLIGYWAADADELADALDAAVQCAERLCAPESNGRRDAEGSSLHVGVGVGTLHAAALGGYASRWNLLACGDAILDATAALSLAPRGAYRMGERARALHGRRAKVPSGFVRSRPAGNGRDPDSDWCWQFLPKVFDALRESHRPGLDEIPAVEVDRSLAGISEVRCVSSVFAKLEGLVASPSEALDRYQALCLALQTILYERDGPTGQLLFDDKGLVFHAAFGTPRSYHRDDAQRAVSAALEVQAVAARQGLSCSAGVATGEGYFTAVGPRHRRELMLVGSPNNRAARLMGLAGREVLCDAATMRSCGKAVRFEEAAALQLLGLAQVQQTYRPIGLRAPLPARLIGRDRELQSLEAAFDAACQGESRLAFVIGEAGIGKTFLLQHFLERVSSRAKVVAVARSQHGDPQSPFLAWRRILAQLVGLSGDPPGHELRARLGRSVPIDRLGADRWELLSNLLGADSHEAPATASLAAANRADATMRLVGELVQMLSQPTSVFVLEDAHWLDASSWRLAAWLPAQLRSSLTLICLRRDEPCPEYHAWVARLKNEQTLASASPVEGSVIALGELDEPALHELAAKVLGDGPVSTTLGHRLWEVSRGNPLLAEEVLLSLRTDSLLTQRDGFWRAAPGFDDLERFNGFERVITERIDRLNSTEKVVLKIASVMGTRFNVAELAAAISGSDPPSQLLTALASLRERHLVGTVDGDDRHWQFRHDRTREVIYAAMPSTLRAELHHAVATSLERPHDSRPRPRPDVLARHFHAAHIIDKTLFWAERAAEEAIQSGASREAVGLLQMCLENEGALGGPEASLKRLRWRRQLAGAWMRLGELENVKSTLESALTLAGRPARRSRLTRAGQLTVTLSSIAARQLDILRPARETSHTSREWALEVARTHILENTFRYYENDLLGCVEAILAAVNSAESAGASGELVEAYALVGGVVGLAHRHHLATRFFKRASAIAARIGDPSREAAALMTQGLYHVGFANWRGATECVDVSQALAIRVGDSLTWCHAQQVRFWLNHYQGHRAAAEEVAGQLLLRAQNSGNLQQEIWALRNNALCSLSRDSPQLARDHLRLALQTLRGRADKSELLQSTGCLALAYARSGQRAEGDQAAREALTYLTHVRRPTVHSALEATSAVIEVFLRNEERLPPGGEASGRDLRRQSLEALARHAGVFPTGRPRLALWQGLDAWLDGDKRKAADTWSKGVALARQLGMLGEVALLEAELRSKHQ